MTAVYPGDSHWPDNWQGCTLTATYTYLDGSPVQGTLTLSARPTAMLDYGAMKIVLPRALTITLDTDGHFSIIVPATDDPDISPTQWTYRVVEDFVGGRSYDIEAPQNQTVDLVNAAPVPDAAGDPIVRGPAGLSITDAQLVLGHIRLTMSDGTVLDLGSVQTLVDGGSPSSMNAYQLNGGNPSSVYDDTDPTLAQMRVRRGTATDWANNNTVLGDGEFGLDQDNQILKMGDGATHWLSLSDAHVFLSKAAVSTMLAAYQSRTAPAGTPAGYALTVQSDGTYAPAAIPGLGGSSVGSVDF